jgi:hypothetical protein
MSNHETYHHLFDRYLNGELVGQELDKFMNMLKSDAEFAEQFHSYEQIVEGIQMSRKAALKAKLAALPTQKSKKIPMKVWLLPAAATVIIGLTWAAVSWFNQKPAEQDAYAVEEVPLAPRVIDTTRVQKPSLSDPSDTNEVVIAEAENSVEDVPAIPEPEMDIAEEEKMDTRPASSEKEFDEVDDESQDEDVVVVKKDSLLKSSNSFVFLYNISRTTNSGRSTDEITSTETLSSKKKRRLRRKKSEEAESEEVEAPAEKAQPAGSSKLEVQYWKSVVNFTGYEFTGSTLKFYGIAQSPALVHRMGNQIVLQKGSLYYSIKADGEPHPLPKPIAKPSFIP